MSSRKFKNKRTSNSIKRIQDISKSNIPKKGIITGQDIGIYNPTYSDYVQVIAEFTIAFHKDPNLLINQIKRNMQLVEEFGWEEGKKKADKDVTDLFMKFIEKPNINIEYIIHHIIEWRKSLEKDPEKLNHLLAKLLEGGNLLEDYPRLLNELTKKLGEFMRDKKVQEFIKEYNKRFPEQALPDPDQFIQKTDFYKEVSEEMIKDIEEGERRVTQRFFITDEDILNYYRSFYMPYLHWGIGKRKEEAKEYERIYTD